MRAPSGPPSGGWPWRTKGRRQTPASGDRGSFGGSFGLLFAVIVVVSAVTATVSIPEDTVESARPHDEIEAIGAGIDTEFGDANQEFLQQTDPADEDGSDDSTLHQHRKSSARTFDPRGGRDADNLRQYPLVIPVHAWQHLPESQRDQLRQRLGAFVRRMQDQQSRDGKVTRIKPAGNGIVSGVVIRQHGAKHRVQEIVVEPYTEEKQVVDYYRPVLDHYRSRWAFDRPGTAWKRTADAREVVVDRRTAWSSTKPGTGWERTGQKRDIVVDHLYRWAFESPGLHWEPTGNRERVLVDVDRRWATGSPGSGWERTGRSRQRKVDTDYRESTTKPGGGWERLNRVGTKRTQTGTSHRYLWSDKKGGSSIYNYLLGYSHAGIVDTKTVQTGVSRIHRWSNSKKDRTRWLLRNGYTYEGIVKSKKVKLGTESKWLWWYQFPGGSDWELVDEKQVFRGYRNKVSPTKPGGKGWRKLGVDHVERKKIVSYKEKWLLGWYTVYEYVPHIHYKTKKKWVPGRVEWVEKKKWVSGHYETVTTRKWVGWKKVRTKKWVSGYWKKTKSRKKVTKRERVCRWRWSWWRGPYKSCRTKKVSSWKTVTKKKWVSGRWKSVTKRKFVGWKTVKKKKWVSGYYKTVTVRKEIPGRWKKEKVKVGVHNHKVPKTIWGPHKETVKVIDYEEIPHYSWRQPVYQLKFKYERPVFEKRFKHRYEKPKLKTRYKHHYVKELFTEHPIYRWKKSVYRTQYEYENKQFDWKQQYVTAITEPEYRWLKEDTRTSHRWQAPVYRQEPVYKTILVRKERTRTVDHDVETAPFTHGGDGNWTLASDVTQARGATAVIERSLLTPDRNRAFALRAESDVNGQVWTMSAWRDGDEIVIETNRGVIRRIDGRFARVDFEAGTINGEPVDIGFASGLTTPYTISFQNGANARGTYEFTVVGEPKIVGRPVNLDADEAEIVVADGVVYSATFDITYETDSMTYTDRVTIEPETEEVRGNA